MKPVQSLDLRQTKCPLNFVQTCLALEKLAAGEILEVVIVADGPSALNIPNSIAQEGHTICRTIQGLDAEQRLWIQKGSPGSQKGASLLPGTLP